MIYFNDHKNIEIKELSRNKFLMLKFNEFHGKLCSFIDNIFCILINYNSYQLYITNFLNLQFRFYQSFFCERSIVEGQRQYYFLRTTSNKQHIYLSKRWPM